MSPCWCYIICIALHISCAEVVDEYFTKCNSFFYKQKPPSGFETSSFGRELKRICQRYNDRYFYATLHSPEDKIRIPIFSAYRLDEFDCPASQPLRRSKWFIEPQVSGIQQTNMDNEGRLSDSLKVAQAINIDYSNTKYDRGHLNPNFYHCNDARTATFTLTNAVPQDPCFNQQIWYQMEFKSKNIMREQCAFPGANRYFVTGAVPTTNTIPQPYYDTEGDVTMDYDRVSVPSVMWTAACCDSSAATQQGDRNKGFSFGYYGKNEPDSWVRPMSVGQLQGYLGQMYTTQTLDIFDDDCNANTEESKKAIAHLNIPIEQQLVETLVKMSKSSESSVTPAKRKLMEDVSNVLKTNTQTAMKDWTVSDVDFSIKSERSDIQNIRHLLYTASMTTLLVSTARTGSDKQSNTPGDVTTFQMESDKKDPLLDMNLVPSFDYISDINSDLYKVVPTNSRYLSANLDQCRQDHPCDYYGQSYRWCYIDWSNSWDYCCSTDCEHVGQNYEWCYSGSQWAYCSQRSSLKTVTGKRCRDDHECGTHGESYYWCYTDQKKNYEKCCQPGHECNYHGQTYTWCYTGYKQESDWQNCNV